MNTTTQSPSEIVSKLGLSLESSSPLGGVDEDWPRIAYQCRLVRNGREVWYGPYKLGIGHVKLVDPYKLGHASAWSMHLSEEEKNILSAMAKRPGVQFKDKAVKIQARACAKLAIAQKVTPKLADVLHSLLLDGSAHFDSQTFEDWCADFGYSDNSIKARDTFETCERIGKAIARAFSRDELAELREAFSNY